MSFRWETSSSNSLGANGAHLGLGLGPGFKPNLGAIALLPSLSTVLSGVRGQWVAISRRANRDGPTGAPAAQIRGRVFSSGVGLGASRSNRVLGRAWLDASISLASARRRLNASNASPAWV